MKYFSQCYKIRDKGTKVQHMVKYIGVILNSNTKKYKKKS